LHRSFIACCIDSISNTALAKIDELKLETPIKVREAVASDRQEAEEVTKVAFSENRAIYEPTLLARERARSDAEDFVRLIAAGADDAVIGTLLYRVEGDCLHVRPIAGNGGKYGCVQSGFERSYRRDQCGAAREDRIRGNNLRRERTHATVSSRAAPRSPTNRADCGVRGELALPRHALVRQTMRQSGVRAFLLRQEQDAPAAVLRYADLRQSDEGAGVPSTSARSKA
jgi:hypothetical protein